MHVNRNSITAYVYFRMPHHHDWDDHDSHDWDESRDWDDQSYEEHQTYEEEESYEDSDEWDSDSGSHEMSERMKYKIGCAVATGLAALFFIILVVMVSDCCENIFHNK